MPVLDLGGTGNASAFREDKSLVEAVAMPVPRTSPFAYCGQAATLF
jgi:hypothetical protein